MRTFLLLALALTACGESPLTLTESEAQAAWDSWAAEHSACETVDDCVDLGGYCPLGCTMPIAKAHEEAGRTERQRIIDAYERVSSQCDYDCEETELACSSNVCVSVEVQQ